MVIDQCQYADDSAAQAAWKPVEQTTAPALTGVLNGRKALRLPCNFAEYDKSARSYWDPESEARPDFRARN